MPSRLLFLHFIFQQKDLLKTGKREEISPKTSYCCTIGRSLTSRNSNGPSSRILGYSKLGRFIG